MVPLLPSIQRGSLETQALPLVSMLGGMRQSPGSSDHSISFRERCFECKLHIFHIYVCFVHTYLIRHTLWYVFPIAMEEQIILGPNEMFVGKILYLENCPTQKVGNNYPGTATACYSLHQTLVDPFKSLESDSTLYQPGWFCIDFDCTHGHHHIVGSAPCFSQWIGRDDLAIKALAGCVDREHPIPPSITGRISHPFADASRLRAAGFGVHHGHRCLLCWCCLAGGHV